MKPHSPDLTARTRRRIRLRLVLSAATVVALAAPAGAQAVTVYGAASLNQAFPAMSRTDTYNFAGSDQLQLQIEHGAPADVFASASPDQAQALYREGLCGKPVTFATNILVIVVPKGNPSHVKSVFSLTTGNRRLAVGSETVPVGVYTRTLLGRLGLLSILTTNTVSSEPNVTSVLAKVGLGSADAGFAYITDALTAVTRVEQISLPKSAQPPVKYQICAVKRAGADTAGANAYIKKVLGSAGRAALHRYGFGLLPKAKKKTNKKR